MSNTGAPSAGFSGLRISGAGVRYPNGTEALRGFTLDIGSGDRLMLVGPSGAGKSTVLRLLSGLISPNTGTIELSGAAPRIGMVFQDPTLLGWRTALGNVALPLRLRGVARKIARERALAQLTALGLGDFAGAVPAELSGGMRMRVALARALVGDPDLLLLDEPFGALDEITRHRLNDDLLALAVAQRLTVVFVTHSIFESAYLGSRVAVMSARPGRVAQVIPFHGLPDGPSFRSSEAFRARVETVSMALAEAMEQVR